MGERDPSLGSPAGLRFFGRIVAGTSHELVNVLSILGEMAGLELDLLQAAETGEPLDHGRIAGLAERMRAQAERGQELLRSLNRFAHSVDHPRRPYDLGETLESFAALAERFIRLARCRLEVRPPIPAITLAGDPFALQLILFRWLEDALAGGETGRCLEITASSGPRGAQVVCSGGAAVDERAGRWTGWPDLHTALAAVPAAIDVRARPDDPGFLVLDLASVEGSHAS